MFSNFRPSELAKMWEEEEDRPVDSNVSGSIFEEGEVKVEEGEILAVSLDVKNEEIKENLRVTELLDTKFGEEDSLKSMQCSSHSNGDIRDAIKVQEKIIDQKVIISTEETVSDVETSRVSSDKNYPFRASRKFNCSMKPYECQEYGAGFSLSGISLFIPERSHTTVRSVKNDLDRKEA